MSKSELIVAYVSGRIGRRDFMLRLTALGVTATAAAAYAQSLAPGAAAAGLGRSRMGLRVLGQEEYPGGDFGTDVEAIQTLLNVSQAINAVFQSGLAGLDLESLSVNGEALSAEDIADLRALTEQLTAHREALGTLLGDLGGDSDTGNTPAPSYDEPEDALLDLQVVLEALNGVYATVIPQISDREAQGTLVSIAMVAGRHSGFVNRILGSTPFPTTFQRAATPDETDQLLSGLQG